MPSDFERKMLRYANLEAEAKAEDQGWKVFVRPVRGACMCFEASSTTILLKESRVSGFSIRNSCWLWKETVWATHGASSMAHTQV